MEDGRVTDVSVDETMDAVIEEGEPKLGNGDKSGTLAYYYQMMYGEGCGGTNFKNLSWNEWLRLKTMTEKYIEVLILDTVRELGVL